LIRQDLKLDININPYEQPPITSQVLETPSAFTSGTLYEKVQALRNLAIAGYLGYAGAQVGRKVIGSVGSTTGRTDLQRKIDRVSGTVGTLAEYGIGLATGQLPGLIAVGVKQTVTFAIDGITTQIQRNIDEGEARFRSEQRGALINESRSR